ncbi:hypothetical protein [Gaetbulibacter aestuarii]|uniref:Gliding motility protein GldL n=1 Tax=Gaetbulibacter aestuarii TaxID=1502358 RepID=A0ABW7MXI2_9FLAO
MLSNKITLILCGILAAGIFVTGILGVLNNFIVLTCVSIVLITIVIQVFFNKNDTPNQKDQS